MMQLGSKLTTLLFVPFSLRGIYAFQSLKSPLSPPLELRQGRFGGSSSSGSSRTTSLYYTDEDDQNHYNENVHSMKESSNNLTTNFYIENPYYLDGTKPNSAFLLGSQNFIRQGICMVEEFFETVYNIYKERFVIIFYIVIISITLYLTFEYHFAIDLNIYQPTLSKI